MEAKRRKLTMKEEEEAHMALYRRFSNGESDEILNELKSRLAGKKNNLKKFFEDELDLFWDLAIFFQKLTSEMLTEPSKCTEERFRALNELISILTICCVSSSVSERSTPTLLFVEGKVSPVPQIITRILESGERIPTRTKILLFDLITGLGTRKSGMLAISYYAALVDRIALCLYSENSSIRDAAVNTISYLSKYAKFLKVFLFSNGGYCLGANLAFWKLDDLKNLELKVLNLFEIMTKLDIRSFGRQLATSPAVPLILELLFVNEKSKIIHRWQKLILRIMMTAYEFRDILKISTLEKAVKEFTGSKNDVKLKLLCVAAREAWGRKALRTTGGLNLIMDECSAEFDSQSFLVVKNLRYFRHDAEGLAAICRNEKFLDKILFFLRQYGEDPKNEKCELLEFRLGLRPDSPNFLIHLNELEEQKQKYLDSTNFHKDYVELDSVCNPTVSNSPRFRAAWSPSTSMVTASPSSSPSPSRSNLSDESGAESDQFLKPPKEPDYLSDEVEEEDVEKKDSCSSEKKEKMGPYLLEVIDWFTHHSENHVWLLKKEVIETLILVVSSLPNSIVERAGRSIKRLLRSHECLPHLLDRNLHLIVIRNLIRRPCLLRRYAQRCPRCEDKRQFGREVVQELSLQANSVSGWSFLENLLKNQDDEKKFFALSTGVTLIRDTTYRNRLYQQFDALNFLFSIILEILEKAESRASEIEEPKSQEELNNARITVINENSEKLEAVFFSAASLVSHKMMHDILESQGEFQEAFQAMISKPCQMKEPSDEKKIIFKNKNGKFLATVDVDNLCKSSEYYRGMFENPFLESTKGKKEFTVDEETIEIKDEHFVKFLHLLSGCRDSRCVVIESTSACVSLVYLSDKYLALELSDQLLSKTGIAQHFLTGATLYQFAPTLVTASATHGRFSDLFFLVLLRYSTKEEINQTLCALLALRSCKAFCDLLKEFLQRCIESLPRHPSFRVWI